MTSKRVKELVDKVRPPTVVRWRMSFFDDRLNGTATKKQQLVFRQLTALTAGSRITTLELCFPQNDKWCDAAYRMIHINHSCMSKMTEQGSLYCLARVLAQCPALAHLNLSYNGLGADGVESLARVLAQCPALAHLDLGNEIRPRIINGESASHAEGVEILAGLLGQCAALSHLNLAGNDIRAEGAGSLAGVLGQCRMLACLNLSGNWIEAGGAGRLAGVLGQCAGLTHLDLSDNLIEDAGAAALQKCWGSAQR
jgi:Ran GTPase-activating protein (RanGAP) involved in mRNA processing and transport